MRSEGITVVDVFRLLKVEPTKDLTWRVGDIMRVKWERVYGELPKKELRSKTNDGGSHCFAVYPLSWQPEIEKVVRSMQTIAERQMTLPL